MSMTFRSEAFIIPTRPSLNRETSENIIDDVKVANMMRECDFPTKLECINEDSEHSDYSILDKSSESDIISHLQDIYISPIPRIHVIGPGQCEEEKSLEIRQLDEPINQEDLNEPIYDVPFLCRKESKRDCERISERVPEIPEKMKENKSPDFPNLEINFPQLDEDSDQGETLVEPIYDVPYHCRNNREPLKFIKKLETAEFVSLERTDRFRGPKIPLARPPVRSSSLMSIDERGETPDDCGNQFCQHGFKNGCTATTQRPEEVTEEIFEVNWMKRLENLRAREAVIKEKEVMLFDRERLLFKKEKELRILERLIKDKLKHVELCSKRFKHQGIDSESVDRLSERSEGSKQSLETRVNSLETLDSVKSVQSIPQIGSNIHRNTVGVPSKSSSVSDNKIPEKVTSDLINKTSGKIGLLNEKIHEGIKSSVSVNSESSADGQILHNPPNSKSSLVTSEFMAPGQSLGLIHRAKSSTIGYSGHSSMRRRRKPRISYDDLDSTLSADIGDSSFVVTSRIFDPSVFKKPQAFTRGTFSSERKSQIEEEKVLKRLSENIFVSKDRGTKFQDYGLIDLGRNGTVEEDDRRCSYLNLERGGDEGKGGRKEGKERPVSWSEEQNEWLRKKRMAYNCTIRRTPTENFDKENLQRKAEVKKKVSMVKKFSIFR